MNKRNKTIIAIVVAAICIAVIICLILVLRNTNPLKGTRWGDDKGGTLTLTADKYKWTEGDKTVSGKYKIYRGDEAGDVLDKLVKEHMKEVDDSVPDSELQGFEEEVNGYKKKLKPNGKSEQTFVFEETVENANLGDDSYKPKTAVYVATYDKDFLTFVDVVSDEMVGLSKLGYNKEEYFSDEGLEAVDANQTSDKNVPFTYEVPEGYRKTCSEEGLVIYNKSLADEINISVMPDTRAVGIIDEFANVEKYKDGYKAVTRIGPHMIYSYIFEKNDATCIASVYNSDDFSKFVDSIK